MRELFKRLGFRYARFITRPRYRYNIDPEQLAWLVNAVDATEGSIVEVGVARGMTSVFLLEHLARKRSSRPYYCIDTFGGFTVADRAVEVDRRGKPADKLQGFAYNDASVFRLNLNNYTNARVIAADAATFDWSTLPPIGVLLLDVDLYAPTLAALRSSRPYLFPGCHVMIDDVAPGVHLYDGASAAAAEYAAEAGISLNQLTRSATFTVR